MYKNIKIRCKKKNHIFKTEVPFDIIADYNNRDKYLKNMGIDCANCKHFKKCNTGYALTYIVNLSSFINFLKASDYLRTALIDTALCCSLIIIGLLILACKLFK